MNTIHGTRFMACMLLLFTGMAHAGQIPQEKNWNFDVYLDNQLIGQHSFKLTQQSRQYMLHSRAAFDVGFLFLNLYRYRHDNTEIWGDDCLITLSANTDDNGEQQFVQLDTNGPYTRLTSHAGTRNIQNCIRSFAYWNPALLKTSQLLNSQTGEIVDVQFNYLGPDTLHMNNTHISAERFHLQGDGIAIDLWYSQDMHWLALQSTLDNGNTLRYQLKPETAP